MLFTERFVAGRSMNSLVTGLARQGAEIAPGTLGGACAQAGALLAPLEEAITARSRGSWHLHADETTWRVFAPREGDSPVRWWLRVFLGPDTACFVMDATRSGAVLARHAGTDRETGQLTPEEGRPRRLVISSDFYAVYQSAGKKADGLVNLYCWAHIRRYFVRASDANPAQLTYWTAAWLERIKDLYTAHAQLMTAWAEAAAPAPREAAAAAARPDEAGAAWDGAIAVIDEARKKQMTAPGPQEPAKKALATLDREWDRLAAHRDYPMIGLDSNPAERALRRPVVTRPRLPHRLPRRMRAQQRQAPRRPRPGAVPALACRTRRPPRLGTAARTRITAPKQPPQRRHPKHGHAACRHAQSQDFRILTAGQRSCSSRSMDLPAEVPRGWLL
jgi:transposase